MPLDSNLDVGDIALSNLVSFIKTNIPALTVLDEFPYGNQQLQMPSLTISKGKLTRVPEMPWIISQTAPDMNNQVVVTEVVANYDGQFQLDLWCKNKLDRRQYLGLIIALFNSQQSQSLASPPNTSDLPDGLSLQIASYYNEWCRYEIVDHEPIDDEAAAQRQERREKITVLFNMREIRQRSYYAMVQIQEQLGVGSSDADTTDLEIFTDIFD